MIRSSAAKKAGRLRISLAGAHELAKEMKLGDSISVNGCCLTVVEFAKNHFSADLSGETLRRTAFAEKKSGDPVNLERPLSAGARLGGHFVQGHVDGVGLVTRLVPEGENWWLSVRVPEDLRRYVDVLDEVVFIHDRLQGRFQGEAPEGPGGLYMPRRLSEGVGSFQVKKMTNSVRLCGPAGVAGAGAAPPGIPGPGGAALGFGLPAAPPPMLSVRRGLQNPVRDRTPRRRRPSHRGQQADYQERRECCRPGQRISYHRRP